MNASETEKGTTRILPDDNIQGLPAEETCTSEIKAAAGNVDHDDAAELFTSIEEVFEYTAKEASWVRWKLDLILLSMVCTGLTSEIEVFL